MAGLLGKQMAVLTTNLAQKAFPTGNPNFAVMQSMPGSFPDSVATDPFLMCDFFGPSISQGIETDPDVFPVGWHPIGGWTFGMGRHADSKGNHETFASPGMQWISVGSGIEHAEGGGTPAGEVQMGFQIWINVPASKKMLPPRYGTNGPETLPLLTGEGYSARLLAGTVGGITGPFKTSTSVEMLDVSVEAGRAFAHQVDAIYDNALVYVYKGSGSINGAPVVQHNTVRLDATGGPGSARGLLLEATKGGDGLSCMVFSGKRIGESIAWRGPFVMNTQEELAQAMTECRAGTFPPVRVPWNYKKLASAPDDTTCTVK